jgi:D-beta-D-heptose 7-phosphate kinase/D-beta-D-heptose 1-phosphate adenosyltransferase
MEHYRAKIRPLDALRDEIERLKATGKRVVFTNGCFDLLHPGHTRYLCAARAMGDYLVVAVNSDRSVRSIKGEKRPIVPEDARTEVLAALEFVDAIVLFEEDNPLRVIQMLQPDVLVKGGDWKEEDIIGADVVRETGGDVRRIPVVPGYSTSAVVDKILKDSGKPMG